MATRRLAASVAAQQRAQTKMRTATVIDILAPSVTEADLATGWQVLLDFGGGEVKQAGVASTYTPIPGDVVTVMMYLNTLFVIDKVAAGATGLEPGGRVAYAYQKTTGNYASPAVSTEIALSTDLILTVPMRNGAAYEVVLYTGYTNAVANQWAMFRLRQTAFNSGIDIGEYFRAPNTIAALAYGFRGTMLLRNDTGVDFNVVIVPTITSPAGGIASAFCTPQTRAFIEVVVKGSSKLYPHAAAVTAPPDLT